MRHSVCFVTRVSTQCLNVTLLKSESGVRTLRSNGKALITQDCKGGALVSAHSRAFYLCNNEAPLGQEHCCQQIPTRASFASTASGMVATASCGARVTLQESQLSGHTLATSGLLPSHEALRSCVEARSGLQLDGSCAGRGFSGTTVTCVKAWRRCQLGRVDGWQPQLVQAL